MTKHDVKAMSIGLNGDYIVALHNIMTSSQSLEEVVNAYHILKDVIDQILKPKKEATDE